MAVRTSLQLRLPRHALAGEAALAVLAAAAIGVSTGAPEGAPSLALGIGGSLLLGGLLFLFRRTAPLVPFALSASLAAFAPAVTVEVLITAYAVGRYERRWPLRTAAAVVGILAVGQPWATEQASEVVGAFAGAALSVLLPGAVGAWVLARADLMAALQERAERAEAERELLARDAVLTERTRIAREMHDAVGHRVSLMVLQAGAIEMAAGDRLRVEQLACQVQVAGRQALDELRQAVGVLRDGTDDGAPLAPQPGLDDVERLVDECRAAGMTVELHRSEAGAVDPAVSRAAYRIVQEALTNAGRHAPGAPVTVAVERDPGRLVVRVTNAAPREPSRGTGGGFGLVGLRERVRTLDGVLRAEPRLDGGFLVEAVLPS